MRIITWNCLGKFREKASWIARYQPDIAVIQECESIERLEASPKYIRPQASAWFGNIVYKGLGIFSYTNFSFEIIPDYDPSIEFCIPVKVKGDPNFHLIAVWAKESRNKGQSYIGQISMALDRYHDFILEEDTVILGDFNANKIFDPPLEEGAYSKTVSVMEQMNMISAYHSYFREDHGLESRKSFFIHKNSERSFHIDYCFLPTKWKRHIQSVTIGEFDDWRPMSDHCPIIIDLEQPIFGKSS